MKSNLRGRRKTGEVWYYRAEREEFQEGVFNWPSPRDGVKWGQKSGQW